MLLNFLSRHKSHTNMDMQTLNKMQNNGKIMLYNFVEKIKEKLSLLFKIKHHERKEHFLKTVILFHYMYRSTSCILIKSSFFFQREAIKKYNPVFTVWWLWNVYFRLRDTIANNSLHEWNREKLTEEVQWNWLYLWKLEL